MDRVILILFKWWKKITRFVYTFIIKLLCKEYGKNLVVNGYSWFTKGVVSCDIPPYAIAGGNPARVFKYRDIEHYEELKGKKMYN